MYKTEQEEFWAGTFGTEYIERNNSQQHIFAKVAMWTRMLKSANKIESIRELGCNVGLNLIALNYLNPNLELYGYEINKSAAQLATDLNIAEITQGSILNPMGDKSVDLTFTAGVLIHIEPKHLPNVYENLVSGSKRYVLVAEYYSPYPVEIEFRGHRNKKFKLYYQVQLIHKNTLNIVD
ncbi:MAG: pseudaminic acid biosynthesis-associated methylase [Bdellovibrionota bacterium]|nr:pseudaminic acid biosynthesis-associated methylase [Bdellovibrionota bacterium]